MEELEKELKAALIRKPAPAGFAERVLARVKTREPSEARGPIRTPWAWGRMTVWRWAAAAIVLAALVAGGTMEYQREQRARGERAREQVMLALQITGSALRAVKAQIARLDRGRGEEQR